MKSYSRMEANKMNFRRLDGLIFQGKVFLRILVLQNVCVGKTLIEHLF